MNLVLMIDILGISLWMIFFCTICIILLVELDIISLPQWKIPPKNGVESELSQSLAREMRFMPASTFRVGQSVLDERPPLQGYGVSLHGWEGIDELPYEHTLNRARELGVVNLLPAPRVDPRLIGDDWR